VCKIKGVRFKDNVQRKAMSTLVPVRQSSATLLALMLCFSFVGAAQQAPIAPPVVPDQRQTPRPGDKNPGMPAEPKSAGPAAVDSHSYKVGAGDVLNIKVWDEEKFSGPVTVQQNGMITLPLVGEIDTSKMTPIEIQAAVSKALTKYVTKPLVTVTVQEVGSKKYYLDGQASHPGEYPLTVPTTVFEAISKAGGLQDFANQKKIFVLRGSQQLPFNYKEVLHGKHLEQNIQLQPGDHVVIP
jgi:polysaccharide export outer membrane protein